MPYHCGACGGCYDYGEEKNKYFCALHEAAFDVDIYKRSKRCPLKSVDGLIEKIKKYRDTLDKVVLEDKDKLNGMRIAYTHCIEAIKEYCKEQ